MILSCFCRRSLGVMHIRLFLTNIDNCKKTLIKSNFAKQEQLFIKTCDIIQVPYTEKAGDKLQYRDMIDNSITYIEAHIKEELTAAQIADRAGYSLYHFCKVFAAVQGVTLGEYIRRRRLSLARASLLQGQKILDTAVDFGFETASGFAKAFRREFGYSPTAYTARMRGWDAATTDIRGYIMKPVIKKMPAFKVAGYGIKTNITSGYMKDIAAYWENYSGENLENKMYAQLSPPKHGEVGLCVPGLEGNVTYLLGVIVEDFAKVTDDMLTAEVPEAEYAVFTTPPVDLSDAGVYQDNQLSTAVKSTWKYIFEEWFPESGYVYDEAGLDFEFYDERCHNRPDSVMDVYIPVKQKN